MAIEINEVYTYLSTQVKPQLESLTRAVLAAKDKMQEISSAGITPAEVTEKLNQLKEALIAGDVGVNNANRLDGKTITEIMEQIERQIKATLNLTNLLDDENEGDTSKTYSSAKIKELLALNVEIDDTKSRDNATYSSKKIEQEIARAALSDENEEKILELINAMGNIQTTVRQLVSQLAASGVSEERVNELITTAKLAGGGVDQERLKALIAAEIAKNPSVQINDAAASQTAVYSSQKVNELIEAANAAGGGVNEVRLKELITAQIVKNQGAGALNEEQVKELIKETLKNDNLKALANLSGKGAPESNTVSSSAPTGSTYFDTTANKLYIKKENSWQEIVNVDNADLSGDGVPQNNPSASGAKQGQTYIDNTSGAVWVYTIIDSTPSWKKIIAGKNSTQVGAGGLLEGRTTPATSTTDPGFESVKIGTIYKNSTTSEYYLAVNVIGVTIIWTLLNQAPSAIEVPSSDPAAVFGEIGGFGAGVAYMPTIAASLGLSAMDGASQRTHENFGNFVDSRNNVFVCIPMMYYKADTNTRISELMGTPKVEISYIAKEGYAPFYAFKKSDGEYVPCVFVSKYIMSRGSDNKPAFVKNADPVSSDKSYNGINQFSGVQANNIGFFTAIRMLGENYCLHYAALRFVYYMVAEAHKQKAILRFGSRSKVPSSICAYLDIAPYYPKGNNTNWGDANDTSLKYTKAGSGTYQNSNHGTGKTGSANNLAKTTFNGQKCGIADMGGNMFECDGGYIADSTQTYILKGIDTLKSLNKHNYNNTDFFVGLNLENRRTSPAYYCGNGTNVLFTFNINGNAYNCDNFLIPLARGMSSRGTDAYGKDRNYPLTNGSVPAFNSDCSDPNDAGLLQHYPMGAWTSYSSLNCARAIVVP
ncbi:MAG: hypothetical protein SPF98_04020 [Campylobacter sp.]|nr:hypothetical protein [Campylobacter sp.]